MVNEKVHKALDNCKGYVLLLEENEGKVSIIHGQGWEETITLVEGVLDWMKKQPKWIVEKDKE